MAFLVDAGASIQCPHQGTVQIVTSNSKVKANGQFVALQNDTFTISGCTFTTPAGAPAPCALAQWMVPATKVKVMSQFALTTDSTGLCTGANPGGPPAIQSTQTKVKGT
ncbi:MAG TPA: hypothetical protein VH083_00680 [Myxococcales bacterium]|jgi:hypothetical protein|nr:hypothetical protein [Myxococcales bacterium]